MSFNSKSSWSFITKYPFHLEETEVQEPEAQQEVAAVGGVRRAVAARNRLGLRNRGGQRQQQDEPRFAGFWAVYYDEKL